MPFDAPPVSPSVGIRRKGLSSLPRLPLSAFSPPNSGTSDSFPLPPSPSTVHPEQVIDANAIAPDGDLTHWKTEMGQTLDGRIGGIVLSLHGTDPAALEKAVKLASTISDVSVLAILVPFSLEHGIPADLPSYLSSSATPNPPIVLSTTVLHSTPVAVETLSWAIQRGFTVDLDVQTDLRDGESGWEALEDLLMQATTGQELKGKLILSNLLPPPDDLTLPIVKLLTHPSYRAYQARTASLSFVANTYIKFLPPSWGTTTPVSVEGAITQDTKEKKEWKRRIKMYIGPALEAFGFQRIIFGSSHSPFTSPSQTSRASDWYELARESFAELGVEQEGINAIFYDNAKRAYSS